MGIPFLGTIKTWGMIILGAALAIVTILFKSEQAARAREKLAGAVIAQKKTNAATKATMEGLADEQEAVKKAKLNNPKRDDFE